jgi:hypothetical protein
MGTVLFVSFCAGVHRCGGDFMIAFNSGMAVDTVAKL